MEQSFLFLNTKECQVWLKVISNSDKHNGLLDTLRWRVMAPFLFGQDFLPEKWRNWMEEAKYKTHIEKWLEVEPIDVDEYDKIDLIHELLKLLSSQICANGVDFQRFMNLAVKMDKQTILAEAKALAGEEVSFQRLWERHLPATERSKVALMMVVTSYIQFAVETVRKKDHYTEMTALKAYDKEEVDSFKRRGNEEHKRENYSRAVTQYNKAIRISRYCAILYSNRCKAFLNMKKFHHALLDAKRAVILDLKWSKAQHRYAQAMFELGYHKRAMNINAMALERCSKEKPEDPNLKGLQDQRDLFQIRERDKITLDDVPDLVDPSSSESDWSDDDMGEKPKMKDILKMKFEEKADAGRRDRRDDFKTSKKSGHSNSRERRGKDEQRKSEEQETKKPAKPRKKTEKDEEEQTEREKAVEEKKNKETELERQEREMKEHIAEEDAQLETQLQHGSEAMLEHRGRQAFMYYKAAVELIGKSSREYGGLCEEDYVTFLYAYGMASLESGIDEKIVDACHKFEMILEKHSRIRSALPYYGLSYALFKQNKFSQVFEPLQKAKHMVGHFPIVVETWPGTKHKIKETEDGQMEIALERLEGICKQPPPPDAICRLDSCPSKPEMYLTDVGFKGFVEVVCRERCRMDFHLTCWKKVKSEEYPTVTHEKELLLKTCRTPDCDGVYVMVTVFGPDGLPKSKQQLQEPVKTKEKKNKVTSKQKTKKNRKKQETSKKPPKQEKGQGDGEVADEQDGTDSKKYKEKKADAQEEMTCLPDDEQPCPVPTDTGSVASSNTADGDDENEVDDGEDEVQVEAAYILKKDDLEEEIMGKAVKPKSRRKKGKDKVSMPIEVKFTNSRKRQMVSSESMVNSTGAGASARPYPVLDPVNPFSTPTHLQEMASDFERSFTSTQVLEPPGSEESSHQAALHMHFEEVLSRLGPVSITDSRLGDELLQMPLEHQMIVDRFGGLGKFLMVSPSFAMLEDHVCLLKDTIKCQEMVRESKSFRLGNIPKPVKSKTSSNSKQSVERDRSIANLAPEHFPNISEAQAGDVIEQKRKKQQAMGESPVESNLSKLDSLEEIYVDTPERKDKRMQEVINQLAGTGVYNEAKDLDYSDKAKVQRVFKANPEMGETVKILETLKFYLDKEEETTKQKKRKEIRKNIEKYRGDQLTEDEKRLEAEKLEEERRRIQIAKEVEKRQMEQRHFEERVLANKLLEVELESRRKEKSQKKSESKPEKGGIKTLVFSGGSVLDTIFFPNKSIKDNLKSDKKVAHLADLIGAGKTSARSKVNPNKSSSVKKEDNLAATATICVAAKSSSFSVDAKPFIPSSTVKAANVNLNLTDNKDLNPVINPLSCTGQTNPIIDLKLLSNPDFFENDDSDYSSGTRENSTPSELSVDINVLESVLADSVVHMDQGADSVIPRQNEQDDNSGKSSANKTPHVSEKTDSTPDESTSVDCTARTANKRPISSETPSESSSTYTANSEDDASSTTNANPTEDTSLTPTTNPQKATSLTPTTNPTADTGPTPTTDPSASTSASPITTADANSNSNRETSRPVVNAKASPTITVSLDKYNSLLQKYTTLFNVCRVVADVKKNMKCTWTQCPTATVKTRGINTGPDKLLEESKANELRLQRTLKDMNDKYSRLRERYDCDTARLRDDFKRLNIVYTQLEAEQGRHSLQLKEVKQSKETEKKRLTDELKRYESQIQNMEAKIDSLTNQLTSKDELLENAMQNMQTERDLWTAEKLKLEESSGILERNQQVLLKRCQETEVGILNLRCAKDSVPLENAVRDCEVQINGCRNYLQRNPVGGESFKEFTSSWEKCLKDNTALMAAHKAKYEDLMQQVKAGVPLHQLEPPKAVRPFKLSPKMVPPGVGVPFGPRVGPHGIPSNPQMPPPNHMPPKVVAAAGFPNGQKAEPLRPGGALQEARSAAPDGQSPVAVPVPLAVHQPTSGQAQARDNPLQPRSRLPQQNWGAGNVEKQPVSLAQVPSNNQQPSVTTTARMQQVQGVAGGGAHLQTNRVTQPQPQPVRPSPTPLTSATQNGGNHQTVTPVTQTAPVNQPSQLVSIPAVSSDPLAAPSPQAPQPKTNFEKIIFPLHNMFPEFNKVQLTKVIKEVRAANKGSLSGLSIENIIHRATELILNQQRTQAQIQRMSAQQAAAAAATAATAAAVKRPAASNSPSSRQWEPAKPIAISAWGLSSEGIEDDDEDPCVICHEEMLMDAVTLHCGHKFHEPCIKLWLQEQRTCPTCRNYTLLPGEYPRPK